MQFLPKRSKGADLVETKGAEQSYFVPLARTNEPYKDSWDIDRVHKQGMERVTWAFRAVHAIASNAARLPVVVRQDDRISGLPIPDHQLVSLLNNAPNPYDDAVAWRYRLSTQILMNKSGAFIEKIPSRSGGVAALYLLPPQYTFPVPDPKTFVSHYLVEIGRASCRERGE